MAYVDEHVVAAHLNKAALGSNLTFEAQETENPECEDAEVFIHQDGKALDTLSLQVGGGYVCLNRYGYKRPGDASSFYSQQIGSWGVQPEDLDAILLSVMLALYQPDGLLWLAAHRTEPKALTAAGGWECPSNGQPHSFSCLEREAFNLPPEARWVLCAQHTELVPLRPAG